MRVQELIEELQKLDPQRSILTQVVARDGTTWNCIFDVIDIPSAGLVQLRVSHPDLKTLPDAAKFVADPYHRNCAICGLACANIFCSDACEDDYAMRRID